MNTIRDKIKKPSQAVRAMIDGLRRQSNREGFEIDMDTFGQVSREVCFGCAATCAVQEIYGDLGADYDFSLTHYRAKMWGINQSDLEQFEFAIDNLRSGWDGVLFGYFGLEKPDYDIEELPCLHNGDWEEGLPAYERYASWLEEQGL